MRRIYPERALIIESQIWPVILLNDEKRVVIRTGEKSPPFRHTFARMWGVDHIPAGLAHGGCIACWTVNCHRPGSVWIGHRYVPKPFNADQAPFDVVTSVSETSRYRQVTLTCSFALT